MLLNESKILLRFDDFCQTLNWENWEKAKEIIDYYGIKCLIGVIPDNKDETLIAGERKKEYWQYVRQLQLDGHTIAMHGFNHKYDSMHRGIINYRKKSEFAGLSYKIQCERLRNGKEILEKYGIKTNVFFAPGHSYDLKTIDALRENGFYYMSDGKHESIISRRGITCIPCKYSVSPSYRKKGIHTIVFHTNNWSKKEDYERLNRLCADLRSSIVSFDEIVKIEKGNLIIELIKEWCFVRYEHYLHNILRNIYHKVCKRKGKEI